MSAASRRSFAGLDPGPGAPDDSRPAYALVPGRPRLVAERAVALLEEVAATWPPEAARAVWDDDGAKRERQALREGTGFDTALCARLEAAKRLMLARGPPRSSAATPRPSADSSTRRRLPGTARPAKEV